MNNHLRISVEKGETSYQSLFERVPLGLYRTTLAGQILDVNPALVEMLGYPNRESLLALNVSAGYLDPEDRSRWQALMEREGVVRNYEVRWRRRDGTIIWVTDSARAVRDAAGQALYYEGSVEDITDRKRMEEDLKISREYARNIIDSSMDMIIAVDLDRRIIEFNKAAQETFGYQPEEVLRQDVGILYADPAEGFASYQKISENGKHVQEVLNRRKNGQVFPCLLSASYLRDAHGQPVGFMGVSRDITEHKRDQEALQRYAGRLENLHVIDLAIVMAQTPESIAEAVLGHLQRLVPCQRANILAFDFIAHEATVLAAYCKDAPATARTETHLSLDAGQIVEELRQGKVRLIDDLLAIPGPSPAPSPATEALRTEGMRSLLSVPLRAQEALIGSLNLVADRPAAFSPEQVDIVREVANALAVAIRQAHLYRQLDSRERFISRILENIPTSLVVIDRSLRIVSANRNFLEKGRREARTTIGYKFEEVFPQVLLEYTHLDQKVREVFRTGQLVEGGKMSYRAPGLPTRIYYYRLIPIKAEEVVENVLLLLADVTEQEQLEKEVRRVERHLAGVVECANDLVISMDHKGHIVSWNQAAERISGLKSDQAKGQPLLSLCAPEQRPVIAQNLQGLARGGGVQATEANLLTADGQEVPIAWSFAPMREDTGQVMGIVGVGRDLTERRRMEAQLILSTKMASLGVMAGGIAHELRNPLGIISASAQLLQERPDDTPLRGQCAQKIYTATQRASLIIENLLKFSRPPGERMREVDVHAVLEETIMLLTAQMTLQKIVLQREFQSDLPRVHGNPELLQQVFTNLILNACNAMSKGGSLTVATRSKERGRVEVRFGDTGHGIPPEHLSSIVDPFFTTMPVGKGTGLGLSISYSIVQQHQGTIEVTSQVGKGATFTVRLPSLVQGSKVDIRGG
ncbi:MAG: PAS domain S-box protein [Chloroflexota bacterium]|nr:PAS domain S-box protein [Chloroflexota bacterium]